MSFRFGHVVKTEPEIDAINWLIRSQSEYSDKAINLSTNGQVKRDPAAALSDAGWPRYKLFSNYLAFLIRGY